MYDTRVNELHRELSSERERGAVNAKTLEDSKARVLALLNRSSELESSNLALSQRAEDLSRAMGDQAAVANSQILAKDKELVRLEEELKYQAEQYRRLLDT